MNQINQEVDIDTYRIVQVKFPGCMLDYWSIVDQNNRTIFYHWARREVEAKLKELQK